MSAGVDRRVKRVVTAASGVHSIMMVKLALAGEGVGCTPPPPFITVTIPSKFAVYTPAKWAETVTLFHL
jgi:hypothetical protein